MGEKAERERGTEMGCGAREPKVEAWTWGEDRSVV